MTSKTTTHVSETGKGPYQLDINTSGHHLSADEPESVGGDNTGPAPYDLLLSSLGACTVMTLRMYADRKEWPVEKIEVLLNHAKIHTDDCADCESTESGFIDHINKVLIISGDLTEEQRERMAEIAEKCPVNKTLHNAVHSETTLA